MTKAGSNLRGILIVAAAVLAAAQSDQVLMALATPLVRSIVGLVAVGVIAYRGYIDTSPKDAQDAAKEALQSPVKNMAEAAKDAVLDQGKEEAERAAFNIVGKAVAK